MFFLISSLNSSDELNLIFSELFFCFVLTSSWYSQFEARADNERPDALWLSFSQRERDIIQMQG